MSTILYDGKSLGEMAKVLFLEVQLAMLKAIDECGRDRIHRLLTARKPKEWTKKTCFKSALREWLRKKGRDRKVRRCAELMAKMMTCHETAPEMEQIRAEFNKLAGYRVLHPEVGLEEYWRNEVRKRFPEGNETIDSETLINALDVDFIVQLIWVDRGRYVNGWVYFHLVALQEIRRHADEPMLKVHAAIAARIPEVDAYSHRDHFALFNYILANVGDTLEVRMGPFGGWFRRVNNEYPELIKAWRDCLEPVEKDLNPVVHMWCD